MTHPHSGQCNPKVYQRSCVVAPCTYLVDAPAAALDLYTSAFIPAHSKYPGSSLVVDGEVITSTLTVPAPGSNGTNLTAPVIESAPSLLRRVIDDPYWILISLMAATGLSLMATVIYGAIHITLAVAEWLRVNGTTIAAITILIIVLIMCGGATAAKCAGIHCRGCPR